MLFMNKKSSGNQNLNSDYKLFDISNHKNYEHKINNLLSKVVSSHTPRKNQLQSDSNQKNETNQLDKYFKKQ